MFLCGPGMGEDRKEIYIRESAVEERDFDLPGDRPGRGLPSFALYLEGAGGINLRL